MVIKFATPITLRGGMPIKDQQTGELVTLGTLAITVLDGGASPNQQEQISGEEKRRRARLGDKIYDNRDNPEGVEIGLEDVALIKKLIGQQPWPNRWIDVAWSVLDPDTVPVSKPALAAAPESTN